MISLPFATVMLIAAFIAVRWGPVKLSHLMLGMAVGLSLSGTPIGAMVTQMATTLTQATIDAVQGMSSTATTVPLGSAVQAVLFGGGA